MKITRLNDMLPDLTQPMTNEQLTTEIARMKITLREVKTALFKMQTEKESA